MEMYRKAERSKIDSKKKIIVEEIGRKDKKNWNLIKNIFLKKKIIEKLE